MKYLASGFDTNEILNIITKTTITTSKIVIIKRAVEAFNNKFFILFRILNSGEHQSF